ncbi:DUF4339 domain-containing protein [Fimbriiglobus ruber]|uniref:GYF domain-containing protein n=1 Tax=Fimbriiglobus ruber TaxID=1908690 RepID=A0A225D2R2_9BACT|nr:DUF4339 domain-containing protein [Fimbriiglobus ruber]OWK35243.1 hypothetical protein FRUB_09404 [Fimbriiglobus ruber]
MPPSPNDWLLTGQVPAGPFALDQIRGRLAAGQLAADTPVCPVGGTAWVPIGDVPGLGSPAPSPAPGGATTSSDPRRSVPVVARVALVLTAVALGYTAYDRLHPPTPREVVDRFDRAATADEAARVASRRFAPVARAAGGYQVGFHGRAYDDAAGRSVVAEVVFHLIDEDGWKVDDVVFVTYDGRPLDPPVSLAASHPSAGDSAIPPPHAATDRVWKAQLVFVLTALKTLPEWWAKTGKPIALAVVAVVAVIAAVVAVVREAIGSRRNGAG